MRSIIPDGLPYVSCHRLDSTPHIVVDGNPGKSCVLVLSHWPASLTPRSLRRDLSVEIALAYLGRRRYWTHEAEAVTNDHFDEDGLASVFAIAEPARALAGGEKLTSFARAGDFGIVDHLRAAQSVLVVRALSDEKRSPLGLDPAPSSPDNVDLTARRYEELLPRLPEILDEPEHFMDLIEDEQAAYVAARDAVRDGRVGVEEHDESSLTVIRVPEDLSIAKEMSFAHGRMLAIHPWAVHSATRNPRIFVIKGAQYCYYDRYETWVRFMSRRLAKRRNLIFLAEQLSNEERGGIVWHASEPSDLVPICAPDVGVESSLRPERALEILRRYLTTSPEAWDPSRTPPELNAPLVKKAELPR